MFLTLSVDIKLYVPFSETVYAVVEVVTTEPFGRVIDFTPLPLSDAKMFIVAVRVGDVVKVIVTVPVGGVVSIIIPTPTPLIYGRPLFILLKSP